MNQILKGQGLITNKLIEPKTELKTARGVRLAYKYG